MSVVAFIPVRGGSKSIPMKNIKEIAGKPLVYWVAKAADGCEYVDKVYIATDSEKIRKTVMDFNLPKVEIIDRSEDSATDTASTESAMIEFATKYDFDDIILIQATSPLLTSEDLNKGFELYRTEGTDSVLSTVRQKRFIWECNQDGTVHPSNYDYQNRPRRQEFDGYLVENGAFYIISKSRMVSEKCRLAGNIKAYEMAEESYYEIDEPSDWVIIEQILKMRETGNGILDGIPEIRMVLTDCDGVLTDGGMYYTENGDELKRFHTHDGMGIKLLREHGIIVGIITGEDKRINFRRASKLQIDILKQGVKDKLSVIRELCEEYDISLGNVLYIGDDINDLQAIEAVGYGCAVDNAQKIVKEKAKYITRVRGGDGALREVAELVLKHLNGES